MSGQAYLNASQIRAARALLDWPQERLAEITGLSVATIRKLELGHISPRSKTTLLIRQALEEAGLEFIEPGGVRQRPEDIQVYQGHEGTKAFFDDVYHTMKKRGGEVVVVCPDEDPFTVALGSYQQNHLQRMSELRGHVVVKCILTENMKSVPATYCEYRCMSKHYVDSVPFYVYDDKYAIFAFDSDPSPKITVIQSRTVARAFCRQFYSMWEKATLLSAPADDAPVPRKKAS